MSPIIYRQATRSELDIAVEWAAAEGWNPGLDDADTFWATDPDGFVCAERSGEVIATGSIVSYGDNFGFMGIFIVDPELRGDGIGRQFWNWRRDLLVDRLKPNTAIGLDGVFDMQPANPSSWTRRTTTVTHWRSRINTAWPKSSDALACSTDVPQHSPGPTSTE